MSEEKDDEEQMDVHIISMREMQLLPPASHLCQKCATDHPDELPHNQQSLYWHMWFKKEYGRGPTWEDAMAHCTEEMKQEWRFHLGMLIDEPQR